MKDVGDKEKEGWLAIAAISLRCVTAKNNCNINMIYNDNSNLINLLPA
jgi:hypothetical protein